MSDNDNNIKEIKGQPFNDTFRLGGPPTLVYIQPPYHLNAMEFYIISKSNKLEIFSSAILIFAFTLSIEIVAKVITLFFMGQSNDIIASIFNPTDKFEKWKLIATGLAFITWIVFQLCKFIPSEKNRVIKKIKNHYRDNPPLLKGVQDDK
jgi:hypothetical protein